LGLVPVDLLMVRRPAASQYASANL